MKRVNFALAPGTLLLVFLVFYLLRHFASGFTTIHAKAARTLQKWI
jgi:hypothetical protein